MAYPSRAIIFLVVALLIGCTLPGGSAPTPFTFPTPNLTHTAIFRSTPSTSSPVPTVPATVAPTELLPSPSPTNNQPSLSTPTTSSNGQRPNGTPITASFLTTPPTIDGNLSEWTSTAIRVEQTVPGGDTNWTGSSDLSATVSIGWDEGYLYLAVSRTDDTFVQVSWGRLMYRGDDIEIQLDADLSSDFETTSLSNDDFQIGFSPGNFDNLNEEAYLWHPKAQESWLTNVLVSAQPTSKGYDLEAKIPWEVFGVTPTPWIRYGFALSLSDNDLPGTSTWQSMVSHVNTRLLTDPTTWGTLILEP